jgi:SagB-type dehydrogenase family enzyme
MEIKMSKSENIGDIYHSETKYYRDRMSGGRMQFPDISIFYKTYPDADIIVLPELDLSQGESIWDVMQRRRSIRQYSQDAISIDDLAMLLWAIQGITAQRGDYNFRTSPSAGALYPIETYLMAKRIENVDQGIYHYDVYKHRLEVIKKGDFGIELTNAALEQDMIDNSALTFIWTAVLARSKWKYRERAYRYIYMDAGHICQNAYLAGEALGMGCCSIGAFFDDEVNSVIGIDGKSEISVYLCTIGKKR